MRMKTPEEIKKGLAACSADECHGQHEGCTYQDQFFRTMRMCGDALAYIQQLESCLAQVERERDAAVRDLNCIWKCEICKKFTRPVNKCPHYRECGLSYKFWEWRGVCEENTKGRRRSYEHP